MLPIIHRSNHKNKIKKFIKPKGEFDDLPPIEDLKISVPEVLCDPLGEVILFQLHIGALYSLTLVFYFILCFFLVCLDS